MHGSDSYRAKVARTNFERRNFRVFSSYRSSPGYFNPDSSASASRGVTSFYWQNNSASFSLSLSLFLPFSFSCSPSPTVYVESWTDSIKHFRPMLLVASYFLASSIVCWVAPSASMYTAVSLFAGRIGGTLSRAKHTVERR